MSINLETGVSEAILVANDGVWEYGDGVSNDTLSDSEIKERLLHLIAGSNPLDC